MDKLTDVCDYSDQYRLLYKLQRQWIRDGGEENELISIVNGMMKRVRTSRDELWTVVFILTIIINYGISH